jgi:hypothetical protein
LGGVIIGKTIFTYMYAYIEKKILLQNQQAKFNQTWHKSYFGKGEIISKMQKWDGVI